MTNSRNGKADEKSAKLTGHKIGVAPETPRPKRPRPAESAPSAINRQGSGTTKSPKLADQPPQTPSRKKVKLAKSPQPNARPRSLSIVVVEDDDCTIVEAEPFYTSYDFLKQWLLGVHTTKLELSSSRIADILCEEMSTFTPDIQRSSKLVAKFRPEQNSKIDTKKYAEDRVRLYTKSLLQTFHSKQCRQSQQRSLLFSSNVKKQIPHCRSVVIMVLDQVDVMYESSLSADLPTAVAPIATQPLVQSSGHIKPPTMRPRGPSVFSDVTDSTPEPVEGQDASFSTFDESAFDSHSQFTQRENSRAGYKTMETVSGSRRSFYPPLWPSAAIREDYSAGKK